MSTKLDKKAAEIEQAITERGVDGVTVTLSDKDSSAYLVGEVHNAAEEAIAVDAAIEAGVKRVQDGLHYPGSDNQPSHLAKKPAARAEDPGVTILRGAHLEGRKFETAQVVAVRTGTPID